jgi:hypothetical protein
LQVLEDIIDHALLKVSVERTAKSPPKPIRYLTRRVEGDVQLIQKLQVREMEEGVTSQQIVFKSRGIFGGALFTCLTLVSSSLWGCEVL